MREIIVNVSDVRFSRDRQETLTAPSLGSCVAVSAYDARQRAGGLLIFMLPSTAEMAFTAGVEHPFMFADTAIPQFVQAAEAFGLERNQMTVTVVGGGQMMGQQGQSDLGGRNSAMAHQLLDQLGLPPAQVEVGGRRNRTCCLRIADGEVQVRIAGQPQER